MKQREPERGPATFRAQLAEAEQTEISFARFIDKNQSTVNRWCRGELPIPEYAWIALGTLLQYRPKRKRAAG